MSSDAQATARPIETTWAAPWLVSDELWELVEPLIPKVRRHTGRRRLPDRPALDGILYVLHTGIPWQRLPTELGFGSGFTCWRRLVEWQEAGVWDELSEVLLARLPAANEIEWSRASISASQVEGGVKRPRRPRARFAETPASVA